MEGWILAAQAKLGVSLKPRGGWGRAEGPCHVCGEGTDRLVVWKEGNWWCRVCEKRGYWSEERPTGDQIRRIEQEKAHDRQVARVRMQGSTEWLEYHTRHDRASMLELWKDQGILPRTFDRFGLGYCESVPILRSKSSLTIPVFWRGRLIDIRHRILKPDGDDKYRCHMPGLPPPFFNLDSARNGGVLLVVEGEKKAMVLDSIGYTAVISYSGRSLLDRLHGVLQRVALPAQEIVFIPDPDARREVRSKVYQLAQDWPRLSLLEIPMKPDDLIIEYGPDAFIGAFEQRQRISNR